jgi:hypothetical protein
MKWLQGMFLRAEGPYGMLHSFWWKLL